MRTAARRGASRAEGVAHPVRPAGNPDYRPYHPRWYRARTPIFWWLRSRRYTLFIARELTSVFVAYAALLTLAVAWQLARGPEAYAAFLSWLAHPGVVALHALALAALLMHSVTWLNLAPRALVLHVGSYRVPSAAILLGHYALWGVVSGMLIALLAGRW